MIATSTPDPARPDDPETDAPARPDASRRADVSRTRTRRRRSHHGPSRRHLRDAAMVVVGAVASAGVFGVAGSSAAPDPVAAASTPTAAGDPVADPAADHLDRRLARDAADRAEAAGPARGAWDDLADCESGDWIDGVPQHGTARWDYGLAFDHGDRYQGGLNFHPRTWDAFRDVDLPDHAGQATRGEQIRVAERVLEAQGWGAWPVCSRKLGLR